MNAITRSVLLSLLTTDRSLSRNERVTLRRLVDDSTDEPTNGLEAGSTREPAVKTPVSPSRVSHVAGSETPSQAAADRDQPVLLTQRDTAKILGVDRGTVWRMKRHRILNPIELSRGTVRYRREEVMALAASGWRATAKS